MATDSTNSDSGINKTRYKMSEEGSPGLIHLESRVTHLEDDVREIKSGIKTLLDRPQSPGLIQVLGTLATTLVVVGFIFTFARYNLSEAVQPVRDDVATITVRLFKIDDEHRTSQIKLAVLEERANWIRSQSNWQAKTDRAP